MCARHHTLALPAALGLALYLSGCVLPPNSDSLGAEARLALMAASYDDPYHAANAAAQSEITDRLVATKLLQELASRYRAAGRNRQLGSAKTVWRKDLPIEKPAASREILASPGRVALAAAAMKKTEDDIYLALRASFAGAEGFNGLVNRCLDTIAASVGKPTYNPKLFDWLCRAAILPEAVIEMSEDDQLDNERMTAFTIAIDRLLTFAERCRGSTAPGCGDADKTIAQIIAQQPVTPVPQYLNKNTVDRAAIPAPAPGRMGNQPAEPITSPTSVRYAHD